MKPKAWALPVPPRWWRTSLTPKPRTPPAVQHPVSSSRPGSGPRSVAGGNATTPSFWRSATPRGVADRRMEYRPDRDGMAWISLYLPGDTACAIWNRTTATARGLQGPAENRTITQLRPDIAASLLLGAGNTTTELGKVPTPRADVLVTVPVVSFLGLTDEPAVLDGLGPIPASMARKLVADGAHSFYRVLVDPRDGAPLEIGRTRYRLTETIKQWIRMRDGKCTFPGCNNQSPDNDTDHLTAWEHGGTTGASNLGQLCPKHHRLKHARPWIPDSATENEPPGWTSPTGRHYNPEHPAPEPTHWPPWLMPTAVRPKETSPKETSPAEIRLEDLPQWEPDGDNLVDLNDLSAEDPLWAEFFTTPSALHQDYQLGGVDQPGWCSAPLDAR